MDWKKVLSVVPMEVTPATIRIDRKTAISAYSMAVAPFVSRR